MNIRASGRAAIIVAAGLWTLANGAAHAQDAAPDQATAVGSATGVAAAPAKPMRIHAKSKKEAARHHKPARHTAEAKPSDEDAAKADSAAADTPAAPAPDKAAFTPAVANANAQWPATDAAPTSNAAMSAQAGNVLSQMGAQGEQPATASPPDAAADHAQVVAPDQLNELDRAAEEKPQENAAQAGTQDKPPLTLAQATLDTPTASASAGSDSNSPWTQTSMIGKIFIAFGGLLTVASAARMFMA